MHADPELLISNHESRTNLRLQYWRVLLLYFRWIAEPYLRWRFYGTSFCHGRAWVAVHRRWPQVITSVLNHFWSPLRCFLSAYPLFVNVSCTMLWMSKNTLKWHYYLTGPKDHIIINIMQMYIQHINSNTWDDVQELHTRCGGHKSFKYRATLSTTPGKTLHLAASFIWHWQQVRKPSTYDAPTNIGRCNSYLRFNHSFSYFCRYESVFPSNWIHNYYIFIYNTKLLIHYNSKIAICLYYLIFKGKTYFSVANLVQRRIHTKYSSSKSLFTNVNINDDTMKCSEWLNLINKEASMNFI